jgi:two-component system, chemotaxis family, sensor kinase Cph1
MTDEQIRIATANCDNAPIHTPQGLQPFGAIFGIDIWTNEIAFCSQNIQDFISTTIDDLLASSADNIFIDWSDKIDKIVSKLKNSTFINENVEIFGRQHFVRIVKSDGFIIFEFQDEESASASAEHLEFMNQTNETLQFANSIEEVFTLFLDSMQRYLGFDRVMLYKFDKKFDGEVICESKNESLNSYIGHRFPSADIPENARKLYAKNPVRLIPDTASNPSPLVFKSLKYDALIVDLSMINSRAVAPIHLEYLGNMSVSASMSISIVEGGSTLWGLIACHNNTPKYIPLQKRLWCEQASKMLSVAVQDRGAADRNYTSAIRHAILSELVSICVNGFDVLLKHKEDEIGKLLIGMIKADGVALCDSKRTIQIGITPSPESIAEIVNFLSSDPLTPVCSVNSLSELHKKYEKIRKKASGVLLLKLSEQNSIIWFRGEAKTRIAWAGQPIKKFYDDNGTLRISPRKSFDTWHEEQYLTGEEWSDEDAYLAKSLYKMILKSKLDGYANLQDLQATGLTDSMFQVFDIMSQSVLTTDLDGVINYTNKAFEKMSGYLDGDAIGRSANILSSGRHNRTFYANIWTTILGMKVWKGRIINCRKDGEHYKVDVTIAPIVSLKGDIMGFVGIEHEITELTDMIDSEIKEKEAALVSLADKNHENAVVGSIELSNIKFQTKKEILSQIAHHWRNPLSVISLYIQDLSFAYQANEINEEYITDFDSKCKKAIASMSQTINNFSSYFKPEGAQESFGIADTVNETITAFKDYLADKKIFIEQDNEVKCCVFGYKSALRAVLIELFNNISDEVEARNLSRADVWIQTYKQDETVVLEVSDNCGGIEKIEKVFEPYFTTKGVAAGVGLGLFEVKVLVEKYLDGTVEASNGVLGVKFTIRLNTKECR